MKTNLMCLTKYGFHLHLVLLLKILIIFFQSTGEIQSFYFWDCRYSTYIFTLIALAHNFIIHGIGILLAFKIRKIQISVLNEYRYNLAILLISIAITVITVLCVYAIGPDPSLYAFFYSVFITIGCIAFLFLSFIPKVSLNNNY